MDWYVIIIIIIIICLIVWFFYPKPSNKLTKLWTQHFLYTRLVTTEFFNSGPELDVFKTRLLQNQKDIGNYFRVKYGDFVGQVITDKLTEHILIAVDVLTDVKTNSPNKDNDIKRFYDNADVIGSYLDNLFGTNTFKHHMKMHIESLINNVVAFVSKDYPNDVKTLDIYFNSGMDMATDMNYYAQ